jgi:hypothetical protein
VVLKGSSHLQFLDKQLPLFAMFSNNGPTPDEVVREITQVRHEQAAKGSPCLCSWWCGR